MVKSKSPLGPVEQPRKQKQTLSSQSSVPSSSPARSGDPSADPPQVPPPLSYEELKAELARLRSLEQTQSDVLRGVAPASLPRSSGNPTGGNTDTSQAKDQPQLNPEILVDTSIVGTPITIEEDELPVNLTGGSPIRDTPSIGGSQVETSASPTDVENINMPSSHLQDPPIIDPFTRPPSPSTSPLVDVAPLVPPTDQAST